MASLPEGWAEHVDAGTGRIFFYNAQTQESAWERPTGTSLVQQSLPQPLQQQTSQELSDGWQECIDPASGRAFYFNASKGESLWEKPPVVSPLPAEWTEHVDASSGRTFFFNSMTGDSSWERPQVKDVTQACPQPEPEPQPQSCLLQSWTEHVEPITGKKFFFNEETGESSWDRPCGGSPAVPSGAEQSLGVSSDVKQTPGVPSDVKLYLASKMERLASAKQETSPDGIEASAYMFTNTSRKAVVPCSTSQPKQQEQQRQQQLYAGVGAHGLSSLRGCVGVLGGDQAAMQHEFVLPGKKLGQGSFGEVHLVQQKTSGRQLVLKTVTKQSGAREERSAMAREIDVLRAMDHPHIIRIFGFYEDYRHMYVIMEFAEGGELLMAIRHSCQTGTYIDEGWSATVMQHTLSAISYCHERGVMHKDLKCENIMLLKRAPVGKSMLEVLPHAVVIDLGLAELFTGQRARSSLQAGTCTTMAPEVWQGSFGPKCDVWSLGCVLFEMLSGKTPFLARNLEDASEWLRLQQTGPDWNSLNHTTAEARQLCQRMLQFDQRPRPEAKHCLAAAWVKQRAGSLQGMQSNGVTARRRVSNDQIATALGDWRQRSELQKAVCFKIAADLNTGSVEELNTVFRSFDKDGNGTLSRPELQAALIKVGVDVSSTSQLVESFDQNQDGRCEYSEFLAACLSALEHRFDDLLWDAFKQLDLDGNGYLSPDEVRCVFKNLAAGPKNHKATSLAVDASMRALDANRDGRVTFDEFLSYFGRTPAQATSKDLKKTSPAAGRSCGRFADVDIDKLLSDVETEEAADIGPGLKPQIPTVVHAGYSHNPSTATYNQDKENIDTSELDALLADLA